LTLAAPSHGGFTMRKHITGFSNPTVKYLRSLRDKMGALSDLREGLK
jgi:hypothetical protein